MATTAIERLSELGRPGKILAPQLDLLRALGPVSARAAWREHAAVADWAPRVRDQIYEWIWRDAADELGAEVEALGRGFFAITRKSVRTVVWYQQVMLDDAVHLMLALDKNMAQGALSGVGLPVSRYVELAADDVDGGLAFLAAVGAPCVVKPASGTSGGDGVTCGVRTQDQFRRAVVWARRWDTQRLHVEVQAEGEEYRFLFLDGELLGIVRRRPPTLVGDGRSTVVELIAGENRRRADLEGHGGTAPLYVDLDCVLTVAASGYTLGSVLPKGVAVPAKTMANQSGAPDTDTVAEHEVSADLLADAAAAARASELRLASVEIITPDRSRSLTAAGGVVVEVNGTPGLTYHYLVSDPERRARVAVPILARLLDSPSAR